MRRFAFSTTEVVKSRRRSEVSGTLASRAEAEAEALALNISVPSDGLQGRSRLEKLMHTWLDVSDEAGRRLSDEAGRRHSESIFCMHPEDAERIR